MGDEQDLYSQEKQNNEAVGNKSALSGAPCSSLPSSFLNMDRGFIKLWRKFEDWYGSNSPYRLSLWIWILSLATHKKQRKIFKKKIININPGQFITGRRFLSTKTGISQSHIERLLKEFEKEKMIRQQTSTKNRVISILNWNNYQFKDNSKDNALDSKGTAKGQQRDTNKNGKKGKNGKNVFTPPTLEEVSKYCKEHNYPVDAQKFIDHYTTSNWYRGKTKIKDWKACVRTWVGRIPVNTKRNDKL